MQSLPTKRPFCQSAVCDLFIEIERLSHLKRTVSSCPSESGTLPSMASHDSASGDWPQAMGQPAILPWESDRRSADRRVFLCQQHVAFLAEGEVPGANDFQQVRCLDLSPYGLSFLLDQEPRTKCLMLAFGEPTTGKLISAEVVRVEAVTIDGRAAYRIGCRFLWRRIEQ